MTASGQGLIRADNLRGAFSAAVSYALIKMFGPLTVKPSESKGDKTGSWRTQLRPHYLHKDCIACRMCLLICPEGCVHGKEKNAFWADYNFCKGCGVCADICPKKDIAMVVEESKGEDK